MDRNLNADAAKFLELLADPCTETDEHDWHKCKRCLALEELEQRQPLALKFVEAAISALRRL